MQTNIGPLTQQRLEQLGANPSREERDKASDAAVEQARDQAYDQARKELYNQRHHEEVEVRVAREEAHAVGGYFGLSQNEIGMELENRTFDKWRAWAESQVVLMEQAKSAAYSGGAGSQGGSTTKADGLGETGEEQGSALVEEAQRGMAGTERIPGSPSGQKALGGAAVHP